MPNPITTTKIAATRKRNPYDTTLYFPPATCLNLNIIVMFRKKLSHELRPKFKSDLP